MRVAIFVCLMTLAAAVADAAQNAAPPRWPSEGPPRPLPSRDVKFPPYEIRTLPNGLQVVAVLHHEQPAVSMRMIVRAGSALDPKPKLGLAHLAASLLDQGTTTRSAKDLNDEVDFIGAILGAGAGTDLSHINLVVMKDSFEEGLKILSDVARHPAFAQAEIDRQRQQLLSNLRVSFDDPGFVANAVFDRLVYGFHPYGLPHTGTPETIAAITREDLLAFHERNFAPNNAILAIVGDVTAEEAFDGVRKVFGDWARRDVPAEKFIEPPSPTRRVVVVNKPDAVQTEVRVGHVGIKRNNPDYMAVNLAIRILGGEGSNRLHQVLRTERSLTYGAQAEMDTLKESGDFEAETNTRSEATGEVLRLIVDEFWRLQRDRVSERELGDAKAYLTGSFPLTIETPDAIATQVLNVVFYGLPIEELQTFRERVNAVTPDDIQRVARYYLQPGRLSVVLVGNASAFAAQLRGLGFGSFETVDLGDLDLSAADFKRPKRAAAIGDGGGAGPRLARNGRHQLTAYRPSAQQAATFSAEEGAKARQLLDRVIAAKGGLDTLKGVRSIKAVTAAETPTPQGPVATETTTYLEYPNRVRVETRLPEATVVQAYDGTRGWVRDPNGVHDVPDRMIRDLEDGLKRDTIAVLLAAHNGSLRPRVLPDVKDTTSARLFHALELSGVGLEPMVLFVDQDTHLIAKQSYVAGGQGQPLVEEFFSDYKPVNGVQIAFTAKVRRGGQEVLDRRVTEIRINDSLEPTLFKRPTS